MNKEDITLDSLNENLVKTAKYVYTNNNQYDKNFQIIKGIIDNIDAKIQSQDKNIYDLEAKNRSLETKFNGILIKIHDEILYNKELRERPEVPGMYMGGLNQTNTRKSRNPRISRKTRNPRNSRKSRKGRKTRKYKN